MFALAFALLALAEEIHEPPRFAGRDPFALLGAHRVELGEDGSPLVTVGIEQGEEEVAIAFPGGGTIHLPDGGRLEVGPGEVRRFAVVSGIPARVRYRVQVALFPFSAREEVAREVARWQSRGHRVLARTVGASFAVAGRLVDTRRWAVLLEGGESRQEAEALLAHLGEDELLRRVVEEVVARATGRVEVRDARGRVLASARDAVYVEAEPPAIVRAVEHDIGFAGHGREDRRYRGGLFVTVDAAGQTAVVNLVRLEELLHGIVPSEIFASAPEEALKAQAIAARGEVLAKIGQRHLADPFHLCAEQHCQVYRGLTGEHPRTGRAVEETRGMLLFGEAGGLVDTVYSSTCGGHTEDNDAVWGTPPDPHLRGRPDVWDLSAHAGRPTLEEFLVSAEGAMCGASSFSRPDKLRWTREISDAELAARTTELGIGRVLEMEVLTRGVSGRATRLRLSGEEGEAEVRGELAIRRLLGNLESSLFVIERLPGRWRFRGAGWGHGAGMCQMGAIARAERGADHRAILEHYYPGARLVRLY